MQRAHPALEKINSEGSILIFILAKLLDSKEKKSLEHPSKRASCFKGEKYLIVNRLFNSNALC